MAFAGGSRTPPQACPKSRVLQKAGVFEKHTGTPPPSPCAYTVAVAVGQSLCTGSWSRPHQAATSRVSH